MANIRVDVNYTIRDGSEIVFRSPVDCSAITGLVVYYAAEDGSATSKEFALTDAHGQNVGDIDHLFAENVIVKVILDVTGGLAYVQNADTNAYIENTFMKILADIAELKYVPIDITSISNNVGTKELGSSVDSVTVSWAVNKEPMSQTVQGESVDVSARSKTIPGPFTNSKSFAVTATDEKGKTDSESTSISFLNGVYYGVLEDGAEANSETVLTLTKKLQGSKALTFTVNAGATQKIVFALPTRYGTPNFNVGGFDGGFSLVKTFDFTNSSEYTESYDVWMSENVGLGTTTVIVT